MKNTIIGFAFFLSFVLACSQGANGISVVLDQPMYNRARFFKHHPEDLPVERPKGEVTTIFDTEQMTSFEVKVRGGDVDYRRSQFRIALVDYNNNGLFNELGIDKLLLERYGSDTSTLIYPLKPNLTLLQPFTQFRVDGQFFEIDYLDEKGHYLEFHPIGRSDALKPTILNTRLPNIKLKDREGQLFSLRDLQEANKPLVIVLWENRHHVWDNRIEELIVFYQQNPELMTLIGIHIPGNFYKEANLKSIDNWLKGRMPLFWGETEHALELNNGNQFPGVIFFDTKGIWQSSGERVEEVFSQLQNSKK